MTKVVSPTIYPLWWSVALVWEDSAGDCLEGSRVEGDVSAIGKHPALKHLLEMGIATDLAEFVLFQQESSL